jgi:hypothetical protein
MPIMNIVFGTTSSFWYLYFYYHVSARGRVPNHYTGRMVNSFTGYFGENATTTYEMFENAIRTCA